jgi:hypothetical protein
VFPGRPRAVAFVLLAVLASCAPNRSDGRPEAPADAGDGADADAEAGAADASDADAEPPAGGFELASFPGGFDDSFSLPPRFAPLLPLTGAEVTREPPGMYEATSDEYFSYAVLWWLTGSPDLGTMALRDDLLIYYIGLCGAATVTLDEPASPGPNDAGVGLERLGTLSVEYCFDAPVPDARLQVTTFDCPDHDAALILVSPQPEGSVAWADLARIHASFRCW